MIRNHLQTVPVRFILFAVFVAVLLASPLPASAIDPQRLSLIVGDDPVLSRSIVSRNGESMRLDDIATDAHQRLTLAGAARPLVRRLRERPFGWMSGKLFARQKKTEGRERRSVSMSRTNRRQAMQSLPDIRTFSGHPSDRFLVDLNLVRSGHPYKGKRAQRPHTGGHVYFRIPEEPRAPEDIADFPAIYAVADGVVSRVDYWFRLREMFEPALGRRVANYRYGIGLMFATMDDHPVVLHYSIEPFIDPEDEEFYEKYIFVEPGQRVKKGDLLARMYIPSNRELARKSHIHFNLLGGKDHRFMSPSIFTAQIAKRFHATWGRFGADGKTRIPPCMGYQLAPRENPFGTGAKQTL